MRIRKVKTPREKPVLNPLTTPIPNYGRGAFFGIVCMLVMGVAWAILIEITDEFNVGIMLLIGWLMGEAVKRGVGTVDRAGLAITLYGTLVAILIGTYLYLGARIHDHGGTVTIEGITAAFLIALKDLKFLALFFGFAAAGCWLGVAVCKEGMPAPPKRTAAKKKGEDETPPAGG